MRRSKTLRGNFAAFVLCAFGLAALSPATATDIPDKDWEYEKLDDDHVVIHNADQSRRAAAIDPETAGDIVVPATLRNMQVVSIGEKAFYNCSKLTSVVIPEGVTNIADNAFSGCTSLTNVVFPVSLKSIGTYAFYNCGKLQAANFAGASLTIGTHAFRDCKSISTMDFTGDSVSFGDNAFSGCTGLRDIALTAKSVTARTCAFSVYYTYRIESKACTSLTNVVIEASDIALGDSSFAGCTGLLAARFSAKTVAVGSRAFNRFYSGSSAVCVPCTALSDLVINANSVTLGGSAFESCTALVQADVASSNLVVGASAFASCSALTNAVLVGSSSAVIGTSAFSDCTSLRSIALPVALTDVATNAFYQCKALECISFPTNVAHISYRAFDTCTALNTIGFSEGLKSIDAQAFYGCSSVTDLALPQSLESVGDRAFERCDGLGDVAFAEGNTNLVAAQSVTIGARAFYQCSAITNVTLPQTLASTGERAFSQCGALVRVNLPTNFTDIAASAFEDCAALPTIDLPDSLETIGNSAFLGCTSLTGFLIPTNNVVELGSKVFNNTKFWNDQPDGLVVNNGYILGFKGNPTSVTLPDGCKSIPVGMFEGMSNIVEVVVPSSVETVGARAFAGSGITNITLAGVKTMGNSAFEGCASLASASLSADLAAIPGNAFADCVLLKSIFIPDVVASVGEYAFYGCASLTTVSGAKGVTAVGDYAFAQCPALQPFEFPNGVAYGDHVFQGCTWTEHVLFPTVGTLRDEYPSTYAEIKSVVFSSSMTTITNGACAGCRSLAYVRIPEGVTAVGALAFDGCTSLTSVVMSASVTSVATNSFAGCSGIVSTVATGRQAMRELFPAAYANLKEIGFVSGVTSLCTNFLSGCDSLQSVDIPSAVTVINAYAFQSCKGFSAIALPDGLTAISEGLCAGCTGLKYVNVPDGVKTIGSLAFDGCTSLTSVVMSASVTSVATNSFAGCSDIVSATVSGAVAMATVFPDTYMTMASINIASNATSLCDDLFSGCAALASVDIPWRVTEIGARAFYCCSNLTGSVVVPEYVTSIGEQAFGKCYGLRSVDYLCDMPDDADVSDDIYAGTRPDMMSKVLPQYVSWQTATNSANAKILPSSWKDRPIVWWATVQSKLAKVRFSNNDNKGGGANQYYLANSGRQILALPEDPSRDNYTFVGWFTEPYGGTEIEEGVDVGGSVTYYAHWEKDDEEVPAEYDFSRANTYNGYLTDGDVVVGSVQVKFAKGKWSKPDEETNAVATATIQLLGESKVTAKGTLHEDGSGELSQSRSERTLDLSVEDANTLTGTFDDYGVVAYRDIFTSSLYDDKVHANAMLDDVKGKYVVVLAAEGDSPFATGYAALSVSVGTKGKTKVTGVMPDGTKVSATAQLLVAKTDEAASDTGYVPVVVPLYSKKGGFCFLMSFDAREDGRRAVELSGVSNWIADKSGTAVSLSNVGVQRVAGIEAGEHVFETDISTLAVEGVEIADELSPDGTAVTATDRKWTLPRADTVKFDSEEGYVITKDNGNPAALKLTYAAGTGTFKGAFKVFGVTEAGRSKKYTANVNGGVVDGVGYGTAVIKKVGSVPVVIE